MQLPKSKLQELELAAAGEEELADIRHSDALTTDSRKVKKGYFISPQLIGALFSISLSTTASYWGFSPAAAIITNINEDIGPSPNASLFAIIWSTALSISLIIFGRTSDKFGRRWFMISASVCGLLGGTS
jgi:MFS family permease